MSDPVTRLNAALEGRYAIERELGEGGMATVYLADDLKHERKVALKVLKPELAAVVGAERFLAEIKTTANLTHPNILPLHDSGEADGFLFYVTPYVEGESLRGRLDREHQLPVDEAVGIATNVAEALDYAHRQGVIHRDIKPGNVLLIERKPVISDFGIALAVGVAGGGRLTETGLSLGTPHYMSPEQATGDQTVGPSTDTYALGCVLYEMLVGEPPYTGSTAQAILGKIITGEPPSVVAERSAVPGNVDAALHVALSKTSADRFPTIGRFAEALNDPSFTFPGRSSPPAVLSLRRYAWPATAVATAVLAVFGWVRTPTPSMTTRMQISLPESQRLGVRGGQTYALDISRDGSKLVYIGEEGTETRLYLRHLDSFDLEALPGTEGARQPFFSPDGAWVGFFAESELRRVSVSGGAPIRVARLPEGVSGGASWGVDQTILYCVGESVYRVPVAGGEPVEYPLPGVLVGVRGREDQADIVGARPLWPHVLPGGEQALITVRSGTAVLDLRSGEYRYVFAGGQARYLPTGHLMYNGGQERALLVPFDLDRLELDGPSIPAIEDVFRGPGGGALNLAVSDNGTLVFVRGGFERTLVLVDRNGRETPVAVDPRGYRFPRLSRDGVRLAVTVDPRPSDLWIVDLDRGIAERQPTEDHDGWEVWAPDGSRVAFYNSTNPPHWRVRDYPFVNPAVPIGGPDHIGIFPHSWTPDNRLLAHGSGRIATVSIADGTVEDLIADDAWEAIPRISLNGHWVAYVSDATGVNEVYAVAYPEPDERHLVSQGGGTDPVWSADGTELFYRTGNSIMAVNVRTSPVFEVLSEPITLFSSPYDFFQDGNWTVRPDGQFVMIRSDPTNSRQFRVVLNWFEDVKERVPN